jgi:O-antigen ligase
VSPLQEHTALPTVGTGRGPRATPVLVGGVAGLLAALVAAERSPRAVLLCLLVLLVSAMAVAGRIRVFLLGLALLDIPLQWNRYYGYRSDVDSLAALAGWGISATTIALAGLYALWIAEILVQPRTAPRPRIRAVTAPVVFFVVLVASVGVAGDRTVAGFQIAMYAQVLLLLVYVASTVRTAREIRFVIVMLLVGLCLESAITLGMYASGANVHLPGLSTRTTEAVGGDALRVGGTIGSPNNAGAYFAFMFAVAAGVFLGGIRGALHRLALASCVLALIPLALTLSRGAWIACLVSLVVLAIGSRGRRVSSAGLVGLLLTLLVVLVPLHGEISQRLAGSDEGAAAGRVPLMRIAGEMIADHPFLGVGANNYVIALPRYTGGDFSAAWRSSVHDKYLLIWSEAGPGALLAFLVFVGVTIARGWRARDDPDPLVAAVGLGLAAAVAGNAVHMNFEIFAAGAPIQMLWLAGGLVAAPAFARERGIRRLEAARG